MSHWPLPLWILLQKQPDEQDQLLCSMPHACIAVIQSNKSNHLISIAFSAVFHASAKCAQNGFHSNTFVAELLVLTAISMWERLTLYPEMNTLYLYLLINIKKNINIDNSFQNVWQGEAAQCCQHFRSCHYLGKWTDPPALPQPLHWCREWYVCTLCTYLYCYTI